MKDMDITAEHNTIPHNCKNGIPESGEFAKEHFFCEESYSLDFAGKKFAQILYKKKTDTIILPDSKHNDRTENTDSENIYIKGDNLDGLKHLLNSYKGMIKCIYIDPPYNTGSNSFVYPDCFRYDKKTLAEMELSEKEAVKIKNLYGKSTHGAWLTFMMPRLMLARELLTDDGVIFISMDENEISNLKLLCNTCIFGEENYIGDIIRKTKSTTDDISTGFNIQHEYLCIYAKYKEKVNLHGKEKDLSAYSNPDNDPKGDWCSGDPSARSGSTATYFPVKNPYTGKEDYPPEGRFWAFSYESMQKYIKSGKIKFRKKHKENQRGFIFKRYKSELNNLYNSLGSLIFAENEYMNQAATKEINQLFGFTAFDYPKPVNFIKQLIYSQTSDSDYVLDFFSGSAAAAHAVMKLNSEDNGKRRFIMIQTPEQIFTCDKNGNMIPKKNMTKAFNAGYRNICEIGIDRIKKAAEQIRKATNADIDYGFKIYELKHKK